MQLVIVGDGPARDAEPAAPSGQRRAPGAGVVLTGELATRGRPTPRSTSRSAWAARRCGRMAFARPLVVQGEQGFWELLTPHTLDRFPWTGSTGSAGPRTWRRPARGAAARAARRPGRRAHLGGFPRELVDRASHSSPLRRGSTTSTSMRSRSAAEPARALAPASASSLQLAAYRLQSWIDRFAAASASTTSTPRRSPASARRYRRASSPPRPRIARSRCALSGAGMRGGERHFISLLPPGI